MQEEELEFSPAALDDSLPEVEDLFQEINLGTEEDPRPTFVSTLLEEPLKDEIIALLPDFKDCFAWHYHEMPGLDRGLVEHKLPIKEGYLPVKQAKIRMSMETELKVKEEIERLVKAGFIRPAIYADWLSNIVPILKRKTGAVKICTDYRNLNEASPKDKYPMPMADMLHQQAFEEIKHHLSNPPVLSPPKRGRPLKLFVFASEVSIGSLLVQDNKEGKEHAVYYLSRTLTEVEMKYSTIERLCLALYFTAIKLRHYMLPFTIYIIARTYLIKYILTRPMLRGRIGKCSLALSEFAFRYVP
ncbi:hypothetical protein L3X38_003360 [Prunus dulcis]|uniref:Reverse transcriptase/retrotransposon-derived protein RNase H-like domain-containing protein n=1 Tax=Prunus dulcis TaxID=3755 RepID=A0AAD4ZLX7_PRUDU|nr:hypothetical protein L3X38_003360 [Prunus dulcis]